MITVNLIHTGDIDMVLVEQIADALNVVIDGSVTTSTGVIQKVTGMPENVVRWAYEIGRESILSTDIEQL